jgi:hypothetical protein
MTIQKLSEAGQDQGSSEHIDGVVVDCQFDDYTLLTADRRVEEVSRRVAEQIRIVAETEAAGEPSDRAAQLLQQLEQELKVATEQRESARLQTNHRATQEREAG